MIIGVRKDGAKALILDDVLDIISSTLSQLDAGDVKHEVVDEALLYFAEFAFHGSVAIPGRDGSNVEVSNFKKVRAALVEFCRNKHGLERGELEEDKAADDDEEHGCSSFTTIVTFMKDTSFAAAAVNFSRITPPFVPHYVARKTHPVYIDLVSRVWKSISGTDQSVASIVTVLGRIVFDGCLSPLVKLASTVYGHLVDNPDETMESLSSSSPQLHKLVNIWGSKLHLEDFLHVRTICVAILLDEISSLLTSTTKTSTSNGEQLQLAKDMKQMAEFIFKCHDDVSAFDAQLHDQPAWAEKWTSFLEGIDSIDTFKF